MRNLTLTGAALLLVAGTAHAYDDCDHERRINETLDLADAQMLEIAVKAGDLEIVGDPDIRRAEITGRACASSQDYLDEIELRTTGGSNPSIITYMPELNGGWNIFGRNTYAYADLEIRVPQFLALDVRDSSGDARLESIGQLTIQDSSGDLTIRDVGGDLNVKDSSGDLDLRNIAGEVRLTDSSGDIDLVDIAGNVDILADSSGDLYVRDGRGSVTVRHDSSGDITLQDIERDAIVEEDSSGSIRVANIGGDFIVERDSSGSINHRSVAGTVSIPEDK